MDICPISKQPCLHKKCIHVTEVTNYQATESKDMCAFCGVPYVADEGGPEFNSAAHKIFQVLDTILGSPASAKMTPIKAKPPGCPTCGHTLENILNTGKLGCADCYKFYGKAILPLIEKCQGGATKHEGKVPKTKVIGDKFVPKEEPTPYMSKDINVLEAELKKAIEDENYALCAKLRDEIKKLKGQLP